MTTVQKTPGYNCRVAVFFTTNAQGRKMAYRWSHQQCRAFRMGLAEAENLVSQDLVDVLAGHPLKECQQPHVENAESQVEEEDLTWDQIEVFDKEDSEHLNALATVVIQAGRDAYAVDLAVGQALLPKHSRVDLNASEDALPLWERSKGYAASFLAREAVKFSGCASQYTTISIWWAYGYDHARRGE